ncbi:MAG: lactate dehydrogenase [Alphaproteobacteria bacterium]|nr:MAG: lactate dehydrogenase [Alphaproteobacteria bacterium]
MKVAVFEAEQWEHEACLRLEPAHHVSCTREILDEGSAKIHADAQIISPFVYSRLNARVLSLFPALKLIATRSTGYDHIDLGYCREHGIAVANVPGYGDATVAEHVFALLLALARRIVDAAERTRRGRFDQSGLRGFELAGKTIAVIGTGRIGLHVIQIARGFGMEVLAVDARPNEAAAQRLSFRYVPLDAALAAGDVITLHVPATPATSRLVSEREFRLMKPSAVLINTARGSVVDVEALVRALADGRLGAAGLDVLPREPQLRDEAEIFRAGAEGGHDLKALVANHVLLRFPNVLVTPHNAYNTSEAIGRIIETTLENIEAFARGAPQNVVARA